MDILGSLPPEISEKILKYLSPNDLLACSLVCSKWRCLSRQNRLWKSHCSEIDLLDYLPSGDGSGTSFKQVYLEFVRNWKTGTYTQYSVPLEKGRLPNLPCFIHVQGDLIVTQRYFNPVQLYRLHPSGPHRIGPLDSSRYFVFLLETFNDPYIVMRAETGIKVYEATKSTCCFHSAYLWRDGNLIVYTKSQESEFDNNQSHGADVYIHLDGSYIYFAMNEGHRIHAVNLETLCHTSTVAANLRFNRDFPSPSNGNFLLFNEETKNIRVLDRSLSEEIMVLPTDSTVISVSILRTSGSYIVGLFGCRRGAKLLRVWNKFHGNEVLSKRFKKRELAVDDVIISRDLLFVLARKPVVFNVTFILSCFSITIGTNLREQHLPRWDTPFSIAEDHFTYRSLYLIKPQFLCVALGDGWSRYIFVFDSVSGKKLNEFTDNGLSNDEARCVSSKCIVNQTDKEFQIYSFIPNKFPQDSGQ